MNYFHSVFLILATSIICIGQESTTRNYLLSVEPDVSMEITGKTNVSSFDCQFTQSESSTLTFTTEIFKQLTPVNHSGINFRVNCFDCGISLMNKEFKELLEEDQFPNISMKILSMHIFKDPDNGQLKGVGNTLMSIAGQTREETIEYQVETISEDNFKIIGFKTLDITQYGITPPKKMMGMVKVNKNITVDFNFTVTNSPLE
ncbi:YceI family protein [Flammeovirga agarivorans]|uniref:YceI family protein n=1 Tax=Flammeovirga agarivorans TaxID=2726742 RepID=A0A7X8SMP5_9BACT|nr:YceI family protein [Flammeovirga agarivorans]NLR93008.1 YceI family protein [Flammeovirga agarivorans]